VAGEAPPATPQRNLKHREAYQFGLFTLDPTAKVLFRAGVSVHLTRKAVETLLALVENAGQVMTKEEIMRAVWGDRVVDEANLTQNIAVIRKALGALPGEPAHIETFPNRGYRLEGPVARAPRPAGMPEAAEPAEEPEEKPANRRLWLIVPGALALIVLAGVAWLALRPRPQQRAAFRVMPVTRMPGKEFQPAISPDGSRIAFLWAREGAAAPRVWTKPTGEGTPTLAGAAEGHESSPVWSPDGRSVAFLRSGSLATEVVITEPGSGRERVVASLTPPDYGMDYRMLDWSPDGRTLVASHSRGPEQSLGLVMISTANGEVRQLTQPTASEAFGDVDPRFSPDGATVSFIRVVHRSYQELDSIPASGGAVRPLVRFNRLISSHDWAEDGKSILFGSDHGGEFRIWRVQPSAADPAKTLSPAGIYAEFPIQLAVARHAPRLVYSVLHQDRNIWEIDLKAKTWKRVVASSAQDASPQYSPDAREICFRSDRSGEEQLWVSKLGSAEAVQVTSGPSRPSVGRWSPDGQTIVYNSPQSKEIFLARRNGGGWSVRRLEAQGVHPVFSRDGRWIYANSGDMLVRIPAGGGLPEPVVHVRGISLEVSPDGRYLYFFREPNDTELWRADLATGSYEKVLGGIVPACTSCWAVAAEGVYYLGTDNKSLDSQVLYYRDLRTGKAQEILAYPEPLWPHGSGPFSLSPDGRTLLCVRVDPSASDVMLVEPFR
jgi:Tol biopolymer transport system component/DNA-binding winged helix-turn-helix (wHTH) protein